MMTESAASEKATRYHALQQTALSEFEESAWYYKTFSKNFLQAKRLVVAVSKAA